MAALQPTALLWRETDSVIPAPTRSLSIADSSAPGSTQYRFGVVEPTGGACPPPSTDGTQATVVWQLDAANRLTLAEQHPSTGASSERVSLQFGSSLYSGITTIVSPQGKLFAVAITASKHIVIIDLHSRQRGLASVDAHSVRLIDISSQDEQLGTPTALLSTQEYVAIGGTEGTVLCLATAALTDAAAGQQVSAELAAGPAAHSSKAFVLRDRSWAAFLSNLVRKPKMPSVTALMCLAPAGQDRAGATLLATYDDGTLRGFSLQGRQHLFTDTLACCQGSHRSIPVFAALCAADAAAGGDVALVLQAQAPQGALAKSVHVLLLSVAGQGSKPAVRQQLQLAVDDRATVLAAHGAGNAVWLLLRQGDGRRRLVRYTLTGEGQPAGAAVLLEDSALPASAKQLAATGLTNAMEAVSTHLTHIQPLARTQIPLQSDTRAWGRGPT